MVRFWVPPCSRRAGRNNRQLHSDGHAAAADDASYVTGQTIFARGGLTLYPEFRVAWSSGE